MRGLAVRALAAAALVVTAPLLIMLAVADWLATGHVLFRQVRLGRGLEPFVVFKFQTMVDGAHHGSTVTVDHDPRVTSLGRTLRLLKLDELPQLVNIVRGEMAFVGPRPLTPNEIEAVPRQVAEQVYRVAPGLTGISAFAFADEERLLVAAADPQRAYFEDVLPRKMALELAYARRRTWLSDLMIAALTPLAPFSAAVRRFALRRLVPDWDGGGAGIPPAHPAVRGGQA
ncbi:MAG: sugar transferase [Armatimonadota bacterium]|nr:sugar transferase [Armatimonadota bacterium]MDR7457094.1 sugar transferase [Armatimonadota bacterium]MDR7496612.1 sugar transferase [Armatimonadota bacterium]MDR7510634.1 sugar transferase [Armatimonadota bacterium]